MIGSRVMVHALVPRLRRGRRHLTALTVLAIAGAGCTGGSPDARTDSAEPESITADEAASVEGVHGVAPPAVGGVPSVVVLYPSTPTATGASARETPTIDQLGLTFTPSLLIVAPGETVAFTNSEAIGHNVHLTVADGDSTVLNADTDPGGRVEFVFEREGGYDVTCDTHAGMRAFIYVTSSPHAVFAEPDGRFLIPDVPPGSYTASVWSVDPSLRVEQAVEVLGPSTDLSLDPA